MRRFYGVAIVFSLWAVSSLLAWRQRALWPLLNAALTVAGLGVTATVVEAGSRTFTFIGGEQTFVVPSCVSQLNVVAIGGRGGAGHGTGGSGGFGARAQAQLPVTAGEQLFVVVGGNGMPGQANTQIATGGFNGGDSAGPRSRRHSTRHATSRHGRSLPFSVGDGSSQKGYRGPQACIFST